MNKSQVTDLLSKAKAATCIDFYNKEGLIFENEKSEAITRLAERYLEALEVINKMAKHCLCERNQYGFDYSETHERLGKPRSGARWLTPNDQAREFLRKIGESNE